MLNHILSSLNNFFYSHIYLALFLLIGIEEMGVPLPILPGDIYVFLAGAQIAQGKVQFIYVLIVVTVATSLGSTVLYILTYFGGHALVLKLGKYVGITPEKLEKAQNLFRKHGVRTILIGRLIWGLRGACTIVSGIFRLQYYKFLPATIIATIVWIVIWVELGIRFGGNYHTILKILDKVFTAIFPNQLYFYLLIVLAAVAFYLTRYHFKKQNKDKNIPK